MYRIDIASASNTLPTPAGAGTAGYFTDGNPGTGAAPTIVPADFLNRIQEELMSFLTAASITPSKTAYSQVAKSVQSGSLNYAVDTSLTANTITAALSLAPGTLTDGLPIKIKVANTNTGAVVINLNGGGNVSVVTANNVALPAGALVAGGIYSFTYDSILTKYQVTSTTNQANGYFFGATTGGTANAQTLASVTPSGYTLIQGNAVGFTAGATNTGATTLSVNSTTAKNVKVDTGSGLAALSGGELVSGDSYVVYYDGTQYILIDPSTLAFLNSPSLTGTPTAPTASALTSNTQIATTAYADSAVTAGKIMTPLGVGSLVFAWHTGTVALGGTVAGSSLTVTSLDLIGASTGADATGDTLTGTWQALMTYNETGSGHINLWQRVS